MNTNRKGLSVVLYENKTIAQLYSTLIFVFDGNTVTLRHEHWKTRHTKNCINDLFDAIGWKARVVQRNFDWYVQYESENLIPFKDGMQLMEVCDITANKAKKLIKLGWKNEKIEKLLNTSKTQQLREI